MAERILVTGATGFAGSHLLDLLRAEGAEIRAWHRPGRPTPTTPGVTWSAVDVLDKSSCAASIADIRPDVVYHCAGAPHVGLAWGDTASAMAVNVRGTHHVLEAARMCRLSARVFVTGSAMVYRPADHALTEDDAVVPASPYGLSKLAQELLGIRAISDGLDVRVARAFNHHGPRQDPMFAASGFACQIANIEAGRTEPRMSVGNLDARRDLTDVRDTVRAYRAIAERGQSGRVYNVCSGEAIRIRDLLDKLLERARVPIRVVTDPAKLRPNDIPLLLGDPTRVRTELGWRPGIPLEQTLNDLLEYWRARNGAQPTSA